MIIIFPGKDQSYIYIVREHFAFFHVKSSVSFTFEFSSLFFLTIPLKIFLHVHFIYADVYIIFLSIKDFSNFLRFFFF